jgi:hypothetical protein
MMRMSPEEAGRLAGPLIGAVMRRTEEVIVAADLKQRIAIN